MKYRTLYCVVALKHDNILTGWLSRVKTVALKRENKHRHMKHLFLIILVMFGGIIAGAENAEFRLEASMEKTVFQPGEVVTAMVRAIHPNVYRPLYYRAITDGKKLLPGFGEKIGALVDQYGMVFIDRGPL